jgi:iron complex outermembrane receptor protein
MRHLTASLSASLLALIASAASLADDAAPTTERFNITSQPLSQALRAYAEQTGEQVVFFSNVGRGRESNAVSGQLTRDQALQQLLRDTGLRYQRLNTKTIAISEEKAADRNAKGERASKLDWASESGTESAVSFIRLAQAEAPGVQQSAATPDAAQPEEELFAMQEVVVTGTASRDRTKYDSSVAISTFDSKEIAQQAPKSTADLVSSVPGFWVESTAGTTQGNVFARGIIQDGGYRYVALMEDGIPLYPVSELSFYNPDQFVRVDETVDRVEALRGGTAPIFTTGAVGGAINFVTRSPRNGSQGDLKISAGDYGIYSADGYWSTMLPSDWGLMVGGYYRKSDGIRDPGYTADKGGQLRVKLTRKFEQGSFELFGKYIDDRSLFVVPIPLQGNASDPHAANGGDAGTYALQSQDLRAAGLPASAAEVGLQSSDLADGIHPTLGTLGAKLTWLFNDTTSLTNLLRYTNGDVRFDGIFPGDPPTTAAAFATGRGVAPVFTVIDSGATYDPTRLVQNHGHWVVAKHYNAVQDDVRLNVTHGPHDFTVGAYFADYSMADRWSLGNLLLMDVNDRPNRLLLPGVTDARGFTQYSFFNLIADYDAKAYAAFASDEWQLTDALRLDFGVRYDKQDTDATISNATNVDLDGNPATKYDVASQVGTNPFTSRSVDFNNTGYSAGFNYELVPKRHALFGHYTKSAKLPHFDDIRGGSSKKDGVKNIELGYKTSLPGVALFATLFQTEFDNVFFNDILANGSQVGRSAQTRTRGIELEGVLQPMDGLNVRFSVTQQDPKYRDFTGAVVDNTGHVIRRIPKTMIRLTPAYSFSGNRGRVFATFTHVGKRFANDENTIELPKYDKLDAGVSFDVNPSLTLQFVGDNLTDEVGLTEGNPRTDVGAGGVGAIYLARPLFGRSFMASATVRF